MKYKEERYINQRQMKHGWSFQVVIRKNGQTITKTFNESDYGSTRLAFDCAVNYRNKKLIELSEGTYLPKRDIRLLDVFNESEDLANVNAKTRRNHTTLFNRFIGDMKLDDFTSEFMIRRLNEISDQSADTISRVFHLFRQMDDASVLKQYYSSPRCIGFKAPKSRKIVNLKEPRITDKEIVAKVYKECTDKNIKGIIAVAYYTGMRPAEIFALGESDVRDGCIYITKQIGSSLDEEGVVRNTKNAYSVRAIPISPFLDPLLEAFKGPILFPNSNGVYFTANTFNARTKRLFRPYDLSLYKLRHLFATTLENEGVDRATIDALMGHSPTSSTDIYIHSSRAKMKAAIEKLPGIFGDHFGDQVDSR